jgi:ferredoxin
MEPEARGAWVCPKCSGANAASDRSCTKCGSGVEVSPDGALQAKAPLLSACLIDLRANAKAKVQSARKWLLAITILTMISGLFFYALNKQQVENEIREAATAIAHMDPADRAAALKAKINMTWAVTHDGGMGSLLLAINIGSAILYLGLWLWAKRNPLGAAVTAPMLFLTTIFVSLSLLCHL